MPVSAELTADSDPSASKVVGYLLVADLQAKIDSAWFANTTVNGPDGLRSISPTTFYAGDTITDTDPFIECASNLEALGVNVNEIAFVVNPTDVLAVARLKKLTTGSNEPLLAPDAASPTKRTVAGVPLYASTHNTAGVFWAVPKSKAFVVMRSDVERATDAGAHFSSDRIAIHAKTHVTLNPGGLTEDGARGLAAAIIAAADQAEQWQIQANQDRHAAGTGRNQWPGLPGVQHDRPAPHRPAPPTVGGNPQLDSFSAPGRSSCRGPIRAAGATYDCLSAVGEERRI